MARVISVILLVTIISGCCMLKGGTCEACKSKAAESCEGEKCPTTCEAKE
jgi:hypothetical protein